EFSKAYLDTEFLAVSVGFLPTQDDVLTPHINSPRAPVTSKRLDYKDRVAQAVRKRGGEARRGPDRKRDSIEEVAGRRESLGGVLADGRLVIQGTQNNIEPRTASGLVHWVGDSFAVVDALVEILLAQVGEDLGDNGEVLVVAAGREPADVVVGVVVRCQDEALEVIS